MFTLFVLFLFSCFFYDVGARDVLSECNRLQMQGFLTLITLPLNISFMFVAVQSNFVDIFRKDKKNVISF